MQNYSDVVLVSDGTKLKAVSGASVYVYTSGTGTLATLYDETGVSTKPNPLTASPKGEYSFKAPNGAYDIVASYGSSSDRTNGVVLFDPADAGIVSVKDYGAKGDGTTDDTAALNAAFASGAKSFILPAGTYRVSSALLVYDSDITISGPGVLKIADSVAVGFGLIRVRGSRVTFDGVTLDGNNAAPAVSGDNAAVNIDTNSGSIADIAFRRCTFQNFSGYGIYAFIAGTLAGVEIENCRFENFTSDAATPAGVVQLVEPTTSRVRVVGCEFSAITGACVSVRSDGGAIVTEDVSIVGNVFINNSFDYTSIGAEIWNVDGLAVSGNTFRDARMGLSIYGEQIAISGNTFDNHTSYSIEAGQANGMAVSGNAFRNFQYGVILYDTADDVTITGNTFRDAASGATSGSNLGWALQTSGSGLTEDYNRIVFASNIVLNCSGVRIERCADVSIEGNTFETTSTNNQNTVLVGSASCKSVRVAGNSFRTSVDRGNSSRAYIEINGSALLVRDNTIVSTTGAANVGAGICNVSAGTISDSLIENNYIENFANGILLNAGTPTISLVSVSANRFKTVTTTLTTAAGVVVQDRVSADISDVGDSDATLTARSRRINRWTTALTTNRTATLETTDAYRGQTLRVVRTASGASTLSVGGIKTLLQNEWCEVTYNGSAWVVTAAGSLAPRVLSGTGTPEAAVTAPVGTLFTRTDGGASTTLYVKESGTGNTGWVAK